MNPTSPEGEHAVSDPIAIALIAAIAGMGTVASPLILSYMANRQRRAEKKEDWAREDRVASQAAEAARLLLAANERVAKTAAATDARVAKTAAVTNAKLDVIHTLVNSGLTAAIKAEYDATVRQLALMREVVELRRVSGRPSAEPSPEAVAAIEATAGRVEELRAALADRYAKTERAEESLDASGTEDQEERP
jgi:hypothetical protein